MSDLVMKIFKSIEAIEQERGQFKIKCLVAKDPVDIRWDLILSAAWFEKDLMKRLTYLTHKILTDLDDDCMAQFSSIITFDTAVDNELTRGLLKIQENYVRGRYDAMSDGGLTPLTTALQQARLVIPLNRQEVNVTLEAVA
ncbi:MAG: hypothetical protein LAE24_02305 [Candidatus Contendobacter sp.]|nr:hypothetical protein [Candidatus Contendobacter sp.]